jgi:arsenate reductase
MKVRVYQYPGCSTCKLALRWLAERKIEVLQVHIVDRPPSKDELRRLWSASGLPLASFFNSSGVSYREGNLKERLPLLSDEEKLALLAADGKLIKRPIVAATPATANGRERVLVGFREATYEAAFG